MPLIPPVAGRYEVCPDEDLQGLRYLQDRGDEGFQPLLSTRLLLPSALLLCPSLLVVLVGDAGYLSRPDVDSADLLAVPHTPVVIEVPVSLLEAIATYPLQSRRGGRSVVHHRTKGVHLTVPALPSPRRRRPREDTAGPYRACASRCPPHPLLVPSPPPRACGPPLASRVPPRGPPTVAAPSRAPSSTVAPRV